MGDVVFAGISLEFAILQLLKMSPLRADRKQILVLYDIAQQQKIICCMDSANLRNKRVVCMPVEYLLSRPLAILNEYKSLCVLFAGKPCKERSHTILHLLVSKRVPYILFDGAL